jgi:drebrin-like protein
MLMDAEGELIDFIEEFSDGRIQFGFLRVKDPNTSLLKFVLVAWVSICRAFILPC